MVRRDPPEFVCLRRLDEVEDDSPDAAAHRPAMGWGTDPTEAPEPMECGAAAGGATAPPPDAVISADLDPAGRPGRTGRLGNLGRRAWTDLVRPRWTRTPNDRSGPGSAPESSTVVPGIVVRTSHEVYLARRSTDGVEVALRLYGRPLRTERDWLRFEHEVRALKELSTVAHLEEIYDGGVRADGRPFVVAGYCAGGSLAEHLATVGRLTPAEARGIGMKLAGGLAAAHQRDIFHRDIRPANVLINGAGEPVLAGFRLLCFTVSESAAPVGPRPFAAPEAYLPELASSAADIYALGATLYALLAGHPPQTRAATGHRRPWPLSISDSSGPPVSSVDDLPTASRALMVVLRRAMAHDPRERYADALDLRSALEAVH